MGSILDQMWAAITTPIKTPLDPFSLFLTVGVILIMIALWAHILANLEGA
jgi:hypothetical protein